MEQAARAVHTVEVTRSVRDAEVDGVQVKSGDMLGIYDGRIVGRQRRRPTRRLCTTLDHAPRRGAGDRDDLLRRRRVRELRRKRSRAQIRAAHPGLAVEVVAGGQPHYPYVVSLE